MSIEKSTDLLERNLIYDKIWSLIKGFSEEVYYLTNYSADYISECILSHIKWEFPWFSYLDYAENRDFYKKIFHIQQLDFSVQLDENSLKQKDIYEKFMERLIWKSKEVIEKEDFVNTEVSNNFKCFFESWWNGDGFRKRPIYEKFAQENPELNEKLLEMYTHWDGQKKWWVDKNIRKIVLYDAYVIMKQYSNSGTNFFLFM